MHFPGGCFLPVQQICGIFDLLPSGRKFCSFLLKIQQPVNKLVIGLSRCQCFLLGAKNTLRLLQPLLFHFQLLLIRLYQTPKQFQQFFQIPRTARLSGSVLKFCQFF